MNSSKIVITEKDSNKEDSDRAENNKSITHSTTNNKTIIVIENLMKTSESNYSIMRNITINSKPPSCIPSEHSFNAEQTSKNTLKTNKPPRLFSKQKLRDNIKPDFTKNSNGLLNFSASNLKNSKDAFHKYKFLFVDDVEKSCQNKSIGANNKSSQYKLSKEIMNDEADLSSLNRYKTGNNKQLSNILTFRKDVDTLRNKSNKNDILNEMDNFMQLSDYKIKKFNSDEFNL